MKKRIIFVAILVLAIISIGFIFNNKSSASQNEQQKIISNTLSTQFVVTQKNDIYENCPV